MKRGPGRPRKDYSAVMTATPKQTASGAGFINANELYTLREIRRRLGLSPEAWWQLRDRGCPHIPAGKQLLIYGADIIEWLKKSTRRKVSEQDAGDKE